jgi:hypothetical protein
MRPNLLPALLLAPGASLAFTAAATAGQDRPGDLPGVEATHSVVTTLPPEPEAPDPHRRGRSFKVGDWDVTISGSVSVEFGTGRMPEGGRDDR